jgi:hypothetical protein
MTQPEAGAGTEIMLAEYTALRTEIERRTTVQWNVFALQLASAGAIAGVAISATGNLALLLLIPLSSYLLGSRYILHDFHVKLIRRYIGGSLTTRLSDHLRWEAWRRTELSTPTDRGWFSVTGWNLTQPTRLAFEGVAGLALLASACGAAYRWWRTPVAWPLVAGAAATRLLGAVVVVLLHRAFERASDL